MRRLSLILLTLFACNDAPPPAVAWDPTTIEAELTGVIEALRGGNAAAALSELDRMDRAGTLPAGALHYRALALADARRSDEALAVFEQELAERPGNGHAHALLAELLIEAGRLQEADEHLVDAREFAPDHPMPKLLSGRLALLLDEDEQAQRFLRDFLLLDPFGPQAVEAHTGLAQIAARRGGENDIDARTHALTAEELRKAHQYLGAYRERLRLDPKDVEAADGVARVCLSLYQSLGGDARLLVEAERALSHILSIDPVNARALYNLGYVRIEQRRFDDALELTVRSLDSDPTFAPARLNFAKLLELKGEQAQAIAEYEQVIATTDNTSHRARAHYQLIQLFNMNQDIGERARAIPHAKALIALEPQDPYGAQELIDELEAAMEAGPEGG
jgi:tetratricopeptide (TPR) repeat protein